MSEHDAWMQQCIDLAKESATRGGGPFGALVVRGGKLIATGANGVTAQNDPTAHAEVQAIRAACTALGDYRLSGCELYASTEPCPMCLAASYWARVDAIYYAATRSDAALAGFDDSLIYDEIALAEGDRSIPFRRVLGSRGSAPFDVWRNNPGRQHY
jgi:tRNA(Arg) A34 adenosine deaminase TadA